MAGCIGCDQATKHVATRSLRGEPARSYLADTLRLQYVENPGGFLGLGGGLSPDARFWLFTIVNAAFLAAVAYVLVSRWSMHWSKFLMLLLLLAGGIGNLIDRVVQGGVVTDFLNLGIGPVRTGVFNVADIAVTGSAVALLLILRKEQAAKSEGMERA
jgi:signal peptidase II